MGNGFYLMMEEYMELADRYLPGRLEGLYIHGSAALGAYLPGKSDIDFIAVTKGVLSQEEADRLIRVHGELAVKHQSPELDGCYIIWDDLGSLAAESRYIYNGGEFKEGAPFNPVMWRILKDHGVRLRGPDISDLSIPVREEDLAEYIRENSQSYWRKRTEAMKADPKRIMALPAEMIYEELEWSILGLLRQFYTIRENGITSKAGAGKYGLMNMPDKWHSVIELALLVRKGNTPPEAPELDMITDALQLMDHLSSSILKEKKGLPS
ncbi:aminoglycoside adenylyltransferase domain-containing protein [Bacillus infantis]|uniref:aminoglycoside adenylyltransferase domain-containing protein n=1 Tax=Bacillus infantis TaxID=324767 RepID=UPI00301A8CDF